MRHNLIILLIATIALTSALSVADDPQKAEAKPENKLVGSWKLVSARYGGQEVTFPAGTTRIKHVTPTQFMWAIYDNDGVVDEVLGGPYTLKDDHYEEIPEYGKSLIKRLKGMPQSFTWKIEGNKWHHNGKLSSGLMIEEVWERVETK